MWLAINIKGQVMPGCCIGAWRAGGEGSKNFLHGIPSSSSRHKSVTATWETQYCSLLLALVKQSMIEHGTLLTCLLHIYRTLQEVVPSESHPLQDFPRVLQLDSTPKEGMGTNIMLRFRNIANLLLCLMTTQTHRC